MSSKQQAPPVLLTGPMLGGVVASLLTLTTTLYLNHDRESKEWDGGPNARQRAKAGYWPAPSADFNWCELDYVYTPFVIELWNSVTSLCFLAGPMLLWSSAAALHT